MGAFKLVLCLALILYPNWPFIAASPVAPAAQSSSAYAQSSLIQSNGISTRDASAAATLGSLYRKSRQSRCVRCYEDRYSDDRGRGGSSGSSSYYSRSGDDRGNWYYPSERSSSSDRYDDRGYGGGSRGGGGAGERDYDRYYYSYYGSYRDRDDRYAPRSYDRNEGRGYDRYERERPSYDRYDDRRGGGSSSYYDRGEGRGYGYDNRGRYGDYNRGGDRYYDRARDSSSSGRYDDRDSYDRYYPRYDFRNYRPWDETYRGQSGFDNSGRGYYFASTPGGSSGGRDGSDSYYEPGRATNSQRPLPEGQQYLPYNPQSSRACGVQVLNCPYAGGTSNTESSSTATSQTGYSDNGRNGGNGGGSSTNNKPNENTTSNGQSGAGSNVPNGGNRGDRFRDRDQESSSYSGRRPLGGSYLLDRESNVISDNGVAVKTADTNTPDSNKSKMTTMGNPASNSGVTAALTSENQVVQGTSENK